MHFYLKHWNSRPMLTVYRIVTSQYRAYDWLSYAQWYLNWVSGGRKGGKDGKRERKRGWVKGKNFSWITSHFSTNYCMPVVILSVGGGIHSQVAKGLSVCISAIQSYKTQDHWGQDAQGCLRILEHSRASFLLPSTRQSNQIKLYLSHAPNTNGVDFTVKCLITSFLKIIQIK